MKNISVKELPSTDGARSSDTRPRELQPGEVFEHPYPFVHSTFTEYDGEGVCESPCWKPGVRMEPRFDDADAVADGTGKQIITVVGTYKPGRFPMRVFFTRKWVNPDGGAFGKSACRIATLQSFRVLVRGYRHEVTLRESPLPRGLVKTEPAQVAEGSTSPENGVVQGEEKR